MTMHPALVRSRGGVLIVDGLTGLALLLVSATLGLLLTAPGAMSEPLTVATILGSGAIMAAAVTVRRLHPGWALALAWVATLAHMVAGLDAGIMQFGILVVLASAAHYGSTLVLRLSGVSVAVGAVIAVGYLLIIDSWLVRIFSSSALVPSWLPVGVLAALVALVLAVPWLIGLLARTIRLGREGRQRALQAEADALRARELADLQSARTQLTRDVHDIVGHSLAVIVAQAESVRFLDPDDADGVRVAVATIADTARRALGDVRGVLESTEAAESSPTTVVDLDRLIADVADSRPGTAVVRRGAGAAPPSPADVALYRATQELLTNALRHGDAEAPLLIEVEHAAGTMAVRVENAVARPPETIPMTGEGVVRVGTGLDGARGRLVAVGGTLEVADDETRFIARASVPAAVGATP